MEILISFYHISYGISIIYLQISIALGFVVDVSTIIGNQC